MIKEGNPGVERQARRGGPHIGASLREGLHNPSRGRRDTPPSEWRRFVKMQAPMRVNA